MIEQIVWFFRILWACRVSVLSGVAGIALFAGAVPAQNLMADLSFDGLVVGVIFWFSVFALTFLMWAFPIHYGARLTLTDDAWILPWPLRGKGDHGDWQLVVEIRRRYRFLIREVPRVLGLLPFVALGLGIWLGARSLEDAQPLSQVAATLRQAKWLGGADVATAGLFYLTVYFRQPWIDRYVQTQLGRSRLETVAWASLAITTAFFALAYFAPLWTAFWFPRALLVPPLLGSLVLALSLVQRWTHRTGVPALALLVAAAVLGTAANAPFHDLRTLPRAERDKGRLSIADAVAGWKAANHCTDACPRPLVIAIDGGASRAAFTAATFVGTILDRMPATPGEAATPGRRVFAISGVSGGAYGAAVIQAALADAQAPSPGADPASPAPATPCRHAHRTWFGYPSHPSDGPFSWLQCLQALTSGDYLSPTIVGLGFRDEIAPRLWIVGGPSIEDRAALLEQSWERHYDYTVRADVGPLSKGATCAPDDTGGLCRRIGHPRGFLDGRIGSAWMPLLLLNGTSVQTGRRLIASDLASVPAMSQERPGTLFAQAYDLGEAMSSPCAETPTSPPDSPSYVLQALTEDSIKKTTARYTTNGTCAQATALDGPDVRLSTAALTSARFPIVSPTGAFVMKGSDALPGGPYGDRVVDGGYFENSGLTTALDVVAALKTEGLNALLLSISNDPEGDASGALPVRASVTPLGRPSGNTFWYRMTAFLGGPVDAILAVRDGHAAEVMGVAEASLPKPGFFRLRVERKPTFVVAPTSDRDDDYASCAKIIEDLQGKFIDMSKVSMSWWLSASVQADLDVQRCDAGNRRTLAALMHEMIPPPSQPAPQPGASPPPRPLP